MKLERKSIVTKKKPSVKPIQMLKNAKTNLSVCLPIGATQSIVYWRIYAKPGSTAICQFLIGVN